uniref:Uncharacterized protein n=1 Tax=Anguilla anguilla TaxID=7936 RepID=A0A0E9QQD9_ANGAN
MGEETIMHVRNYHHCDAFKSVIFVVSTLFHYLSQAWTSHTDH